MAVKLFALNGVPDDEADEIRALLQSCEISFDETSAGNWGISSAAIWLNDDSRLEEARELIADYQRKRQASAREDYDRLCQAGKQRTLLDVIREHPLRFFVYTTVMLAVLYFSIIPFLEIGKH